MSDFSGIAWTNCHGAVAYQPYLFIGRHVRRRAGLFCRRAADRPSEQNPGVPTDMGAVVLATGLYRKQFAGHLPRAVFFSCSPTVLVGAISDNAFPNNPSGIGHSLLIVGGTAAVLSAAIAWQGRSHFAEVIRARVKHEGGL